MSTPVKAIVFSVDNYREILREMRIDVTDEARRANPLANVEYSSVFVKFDDGSWVVYGLADFNRLFSYHHWRLGEPMSPIATRWFALKWKGLDE